MTCRTVFTRLAGLLAAWLIWGQAALADDLGTVDANGRLVLPVDIAALEGEVAIEIDAVDVTDFAQILGNRLVIDLGGLVGEGPHEVTVYLFQGAAVSVLDEFTFTATGAGGVGVAAQDPGAWSAALEATTEVEIRQVNGETEIDANSSGQVTFQNGSGTVEGYAGFVTSSRRVEQINRKPFNLADYALRYQQIEGGTVMTGTLGHQALSFDPVLIDGINRRGVSFSVARTDDRLRVDFFALRTEDLLGAANVTGLEESDDRMFGARLAFQPFRGSDLTVTTQVYSGAGRPFGALVAGDGSGVSVGFDATAQSGRLRYGAHVGQTQWDADRTGPLPGASGEAVWAYTSYDVMSPERSDRQLTLGLAYEAVDADFYSLANPGMPVGNKTFRFTADYSAEKLFLGFIAETRETNFGGPADYETDRLNYVALDGTYQLDPGRIFSGRALRFGVSTEWQDRITTPLLAPAPLDFTARTAYVGMDLINDKTTWSAGYTVDDFNDESAFDEDEFRQLFTLSASYAPSPALNLTGLYTAAHVDGAFGNWWTHEARMTVDYRSRRDWSLAMELAMTESADPLADSGAFVLAEAARPVGKAGEMVVYASYGDGPYALESPTDHEAVLGLLFRANTRLGR